MCRFTKCYHVFGGIWLETLYKGHDRKNVDPTFLVHVISHYFRLFLISSVKVGETSGRVVCHFVWIATGRDERSLSCVFLLPKQTSRQVVSSGVATHYTVSEERKREATLPPKPENDVWFPTWHYAIVHFISATEGTVPLWRPDEASRIHTLQTNQPEKQEQISV